MSQWVKELDFVEVANEIVALPPQHSIVAGAALVESLLRELIDIRSQPVPRRDAISQDHGVSVGTLNDWACRFGLYSAEFHQTIRHLFRIRNAFAHRWTPGTNWDDENVKAELARHESAQGIENAKKVVPESVARHMFAPQQTWLKIVLDAVLPLSILIVPDLRVNKTEETKVSDQ